MNIRLYNALNKVASGTSQTPQQQPQTQPQQQPQTQPRPKTQSTSGVSDWFSAFDKWTKDNPTLWNVIKYGGGALLGTSLISGLLGSDNPMGWGLAAAVPAVGYGLYKSDWFKPDK